MALTEQQLKNHYSGIGGSMAPAILGLDKYNTPLDAYYSLIDPESREDISDKECVIFGNILEEPIAQEAARRMGVKIRRVNITKRHKKHDWMLAHPDRMIVGANEGLEIKNRSTYVENQYGEDGTDGVMDSEMIQCVHYMGVMESDKWHLAALVGGNKLRQFTIDRDEELIEMVIEAETEFWQRVQDRNPPAAINKHDIDTYLSIDNGESIVATDDIEKSVVLLRDVKARLKELESSKTQLEDKAKIYMSENSVLLGIDGRPLVTFKKAKDSNRFDAKALKAAEPTIHAKYTKSTPGSRRFLVK